MESNKCWRGRLALSLFLFSFFLSFFLSFFDFLTSLSSFLPPSRERRRSSPRRWLDRSVVIMPPLLLSSPSPSQRSCRSSSSSSAALALALPPPFSIGIGDIRSRRAASSSPPVSAATRSCSRYAFFLRFRRQRRTGEKRESKREGQRDERFDSHPLVLFSLLLL